MSDDPNKHHRPDNGEEDDDARHRREEAERRAKRKASKSARAETEKDRQRKEYRQEILRKHGAGAVTGGDTSHSSSKKQKITEPTTPGTSTSAFQEIFAQRARGFQINFRFRNAPPRPPVGPIFVGNSIDNVLLEQSRQYKSYNAVEGNHVWKLHVEADIGVPLAPSAMDERSYIRPVDENTNVKLHPDDDALLNWTGSMGDTAAEQFKRHQEQARAAARLSVSTSSQQQQQRTPTKPGSSLQQSQTDKKKAFSRVLKEDMQTWMKKTTYLSNDYSRKVHDFKSLAQTKSELASDLQAKQMEMAKRRSVQMVADSFEFGTKHRIEHPTNKQLKAVREYQLLPDVTNWGRTFTHVVIDKIPTTLPSGYTVNDMNQAFITNVERKPESNTTTRMTCNMIVPSNENDNDEQNSDNNATNHDTKYRPIQSYDLDVLPLKEEDTPHMNFTLRLDKVNNIAYYIPIASRVQLSMGRPLSKTFIQPIERRKYTDKEKSDMEERIAEVDQDMAEKHHILELQQSTRVNAATSRSITASDNANAQDKMNDKSYDKGDDNDDDDDGEGDFGDDDSNDDEEVFGGGTRTIVAES